MVHQIGLASKAAVCRLPVIRAPWPHLGQTSSHTLHLLYKCHKCQTMSSGKQATTKCCSTSDRILILKQLQHRKLHLSAIQILKPKYHHKLSKDLLKISRTQLMEISAQVVIYRTTVKALITLYHQLDGELISLRMQASVVPE